MQCESQQNSGYSVDGAWAEYAVADDRFVVTMPDEVSSFDAAPLTCAGVTTFKAVKVLQIQPGETPVVYAIGGLGHRALQYTHLFGGKVIAVDIEDANRRDRLHGRSAAGPGLARDVARGAIPPAP